MSKETKAVIEEEEEEYEEFGLDPTLEWVEQSDKLHWIFVGGKGGVGKTTVSCSLSIQLARRRPDKRILLISTDPAHNVSDALSIKVGSEPTSVPGVPNLQAMEIDSKANMQSLMGSSDTSASSDAASNPFANTPFGQIINQIMPDIKDATSSMPGIDEAMGFAEIMQTVDSMKYDIVLFDTAPTGHTLRLLAMPESVQKLLTKVMSMKSLIMPALSAFMGPAAAGGPGGAGGFAEQEEKMQKGLSVINRVVEQFKDPDVTTFIPVMIPEFLSLYETERLIQDLHKFNMDVSTIVINQIVPAACAKDCAMCKARSKIQNKYIDQAFELYEEDYHIVRMPLGDHEVRGVKMLEQFGADLFKPSTLLPEMDYIDEEVDDDEEEKN